MFPRLDGEYAKKKKGMLEKIMKIICKPAALSNLQEIKINRFYLYLAIGKFGQ
jgi:hypothetical protein